MSKPCASRRVRRTAKTFSAGTTTRELPRNSSTATASGMLAMSNAMSASIDDRQRADPRAGLVIPRRDDQGFGGELLRQRRRALVRRAVGEFPSVDRPRLLHLFLQIDHRP